MAGIEEERRERVKDIIQELNSEEPQGQGGPLTDVGPPTDVDESAVLARAQRQLGLQVAESPAYDTPGEQESVGTAPAEPPGSPTTGQPPDPEAEDLDSVVARAQRQLGL